MKTKNKKTKKNMDNKKFFDKLQKTVDYTAHVAHELDDIVEEQFRLNEMRISEMENIWDTQYLASEAYEKDNNIGYTTLAHLFAGINKVLSEKDMLGEGYKTYYIDVPTKKGWDYDVANDMFYLQNPQLSAQLYDDGYVFICANEDGFIIADKW